MTRATSKTTSKTPVKKLGFNPILPDKFDKHGVQSAKKKPEPYRGTNQANIVKHGGARKEGKTVIVKVPVAKFPKAAGECADQLYELDTDLSMARAEVTRLEKQLSDLRAHTETTFSKGQLTGAIGKVGKIEFIPKIKYNIEDPKKLDDYVLKNKALDIFQRRLSETAVKDRIAAGKKIPGLKEFRFQYMSVKKK